MTPILIETHSGRGCPQSAHSGLSSNIRVTSCCRSDISKLIDFNPLESDNIDIADCPLDIERDTASDIEGNRSSLVQALYVLKLCELENVELRLLALFKLRTLLNDVEEDDFILIGSNRCEYDQSRSQCS